MFDVNKSPASRSHPVFRPYQSTLVGSLLVATHQRHHGSLVCWSFSPFALSTFLPGGLRHPKGYCSFQRKGVTYIVMKKLRGKSLAVTWKPLSDSSREKFLLRPHRVGLEMRSIPAPRSEITGVDGGTSCNCRLPCGLERLGPFANNDEFHHFLPQLQLFIPFRR